MKQKSTYRILAVLLFLAGFAILIYPLFSNWWNERRNRQLINGYQAQIAEAPGTDYSEWFARAEAYNRTLTGKGIPDAFAFNTQEEDEDYMSQLSFYEDGIMGYIEIPKISVNLPIYHTASQKVLDKGVGHIQGSALPVGGESTHCVLSAHRGLPSATMFTDLDLLEKGDHFYLHVLDRILAYEVDQIKEVKPEDTSDLSVSKGEDLVTLVTCTPYGVNTHRLLVRGHRVPYEEQTEKMESAETVRSVHTNYGMWAAAGLAVTAVFTGILLLYKKKRERNTES